MEKFIKQLADLTLNPDPNLSQNDRTDLVTESVYDMLTLVLLNRIYDSTPYRIPDIEWYAISTISFNGENRLSSEEYEKALKAFNKEIEPMYYFFHHNENGHTMVLSNINDEEQLLYPENHWHEHDAMYNIVKVIEYLIDYRCDTATECLLAKDLFRASCRFYQRLLGLGYALKPLNCEYWKEKNEVESDEHED